MRRPWRVSTPDNKRMCMRVTDETGERGYCGRRSAPLVDTWKKVTCADCKAAFRADGGNV